MREALEARADFNRRVPGAQPARPSETACGSCPYLGTCNAAWDAQRRGEVERFGWGDAVRGAVRAPVVVSAAGTTAVPLAVEVGTVQGSVMLIDVPADFVSDIRVGDEIAAWGLTRQDENGAHLPGATVQAFWRARPLVEVARSKGNVLRT
jgi:hypothetical protein